MICHRVHGFTLIELSIVLVIIGLIIGGIVVGQQMIEAAQIRGTLSQLDRFNAAAMTFKNKYNGLPGDLTPSQASAFGFAARSGTQGRGDGDGLIDGCTSVGMSGFRLGCENALFWNDLSAASLVEGKYEGADGYVKNADGSSLTQDQIAQYIPAAKLSGNFFTLVSDKSNSSWNDNGFMLSGLLNIYGNLGSYAIVNRISPNNARALDMKIDDGIPNAGKLLAMQPTRGVDNWQNVDPARPCYPITNAYLQSNDPGCSLRFRRKLVSFN